jgi:hypothetical protein
MGDDHTIQEALTYSTKCGKESTANLESTPPKNVGARRQLHEQESGCIYHDTPGSHCASRVTSCASPTLELYEILAQVLVGTRHALFYWRFPLPHLQQSICFLFLLLLLFFPLLLFLYLTFPLHLHVLQLLQRRTTRDCAACGRPFGWGLWLFWVTQAWSLI